MATSTLTTPFGTSLEALYRSGKYADAKLQVPNGPLLTVHRLLLASRSPFFERLFDTAQSVVDGGECPVYRLPIPIGQSRLLPGIIEWLYTNKVPKVDSDNCWLCLGLLQSLQLPHLETIVFQFITQRVKDFSDHFPKECWMDYLAATAELRPDFLQRALEIAFEDMGATGDPRAQYKIAKGVILYHRQQLLRRNESEDQRFKSPLTESQMSLIMDVVPFDKMDVDTLAEAATKDRIPQAQKVYSSKVFKGKQQDRTSSKQDSAVEVLDRQLSKLEFRETSNPAQTQTDLIQQLREQLESTIGQDPVLILSPESCPESRDNTDDEIYELAPRAADRFLSTSDILQRVGQKLKTLVQSEEEIRDPAKSLVITRQPEIEQRKGIAPNRLESLAFYGSLPQVDSIPHHHQNDEHLKRTLDPDSIPIPYSHRPTLFEESPPVPPPSSFVASGPPIKRVGFHLLSSRSKDHINRLGPQPPNRVIKPAGFRPRPDSISFVHTDDNDSASNPYYHPKIPPQETFQNVPYRQRSYTSQPQGGQESFGSPIGSHPFPPSGHDNVPTTSLYGSTRPDLRSSQSMSNLNLDMYQQSQSGGDLESLEIATRKKPSGFFDLIKGLF